MSINKETVLHTAGLARLDPAAGAAGPEAEAALGLFAGHMGNIIKYMDILNQVDSSGVEPLFSPLSLSAPPALDLVSEDGGGRARELLLANAPQRDERGFFVVPKVL